VTAGATTIERVGDVPPASNRALARWQLTAKRAMDIVGASLLLAVTAPVSLVVALGIKLTSPGPVLFRQPRIGHRGQPFTMVKFRSMVVDQGEMVDLAQVEGSTGARLRKVADDPRLTAVGRIIRRTSLDELPQLLNVLRGDMSLVGPRPLLPFMLEPYPELCRQRSALKPGITGLWQVTDRQTNDSALGMADLDLQYVRKYSLRSDIRIMVATIPVCWRGEGAV
jgi:exopolysaccharide production protein ExoY